MINKKTALTALLAGFAAGELMAGTLSNYASGDVLLCFRNSSDLVVDVGPLSTLTNLAANARYTISTYTVSQLNSAVNPIGVNGTSWSAFTWTPDDTLFVTRPRLANNVQTLPWVDHTGGNQANTVLLMQSIITGATNNLTFDSRSTSSAIIEQDNSVGNPNYVYGASYHSALTGLYGGDFDGTFQGDPENTTDSGFSTEGTVQRADFYQLQPAQYINGKYLGYFELNTNGVMTYVAYPSTPAKFVSVSRAGTQMTINYTAGVYGTYTLRKNTSLTSGTPQSSWTSVSTLTSGDTATHSIIFTDSNPSSYYTITAQ